jgi:hypothetical protein
LRYIILTLIALAAIVTTPAPPPWKTRTITKWRTRTVTKVICPDPPPKRKPPKDGEGDCDTIYKGANG